MAAARNNRRRRRGRGRLGPLFKLLCALAVVVALTMGVTVFFKVETVAVSGNSHYTAEQVVQATGIRTGDNLFHMNKYQVARQVLQKLPYVEELTIRRNLPSTIVVTVSEWDAVARVQAPPPGAAAQGEGEEPLVVADEDWLISVGGKLLEPAPADSNAIPVSGVTPVLPKAGTMLALPQAEQARLDGLLALLGQLEDLEMLADVVSIELSGTRVLMRYQDRFDVKMPLNADFGYELRVLRDAVADLNERVDPFCTGTLDLTQENYPAIYSPD